MFKKFRHQNNTESLRNEIVRLTKEVRKGNLDAHFDKNTIPEEMADVADVLEDLTDAYKKPFKMMADHLHQINDGIIPDKIEQEAQGMMGDVITNMNSFFDMLNSLSLNIRDVCISIFHGKLEASLDQTAFKGVWQKIGGGVNAVVSAFDTHLDNMPNPVVLMDRSMTITFINDAALKMTGTTKENAVGKKCAAIFKSEACRGGNCAIKQTMEQNKKVKGESTFEIDGKSLNCDYIGTPIQDKDGNVIGAMKIIIDQSDIRETHRKIHELFDVITHITENLSNSSVELSSLSEKLNGEIMEANSRSNNVAAATEELSVSMSDLSEMAQGTRKNIDAVSNSSQEMISAVEHIAKNVESANSVTADAVQKMEIAYNNVNDLGKSSEGINKVIEVINEIAEQTKLLALNASIEAARAGDAGKGFAVVANEVKELAKQTSNATEEIKDKISTIQMSVKSTVDEINSIKEVISGVNNIVTDIAAATEQQSVSTSSIVTVIDEMINSVKDMLKNIGQMAEATATIAKDIVDVDTSFNTLRDFSENVSTKSTALSSTGEELKGLINASA